VAGLVAAISLAAISLARISLATIITAATSVADQVKFCSLKLAV
jgi:hypothetical protein